jgi:sugar-specific transcriptional regulator TrmB
MLPQILKNLGLDEKEIRIFLQTAHQKLAPVSQIAKKTGLKRTTCYQIIENLVKRKFIRRYIQHGIKYYAAASPEELQQLLDRLAAPLEDARNLLGGDRDELKKFYNAGADDTQISFYEGYEEIQLAYDRVLDQEDQEIYSLLRKEETSNHPLKKYWEKYLQKRQQLGKKSLSLVPASQQAKTYIETSALENRNTVSIKDQDIPIIGDLKVSGNLVAIISQHQGRIFGITIENPQTAAMFKGMLKTLWKHFSQKKS